MESTLTKRTWQLLLITMVVTFFALSGALRADSRSNRNSGSRDFGSRDPGPRAVDGSAGGPIDGLANPEETTMFADGLEDFSEEEEVRDGVGPRFNFVSCAGCHAHPAIGGTSPPDNPLFRVVGDLGFGMTKFGKGNVIPSFITPNGPIREARFQFNPDGSRDGGVHALFVISGHKDAGDCAIKQEDFQKQVSNNNIVFRIPTPVFGAGLIEQIQESTIVANLSASASTKASLGISGRPNRNGNDGTITRFGWKAQNKSLQIFSGEAYNVEMGITSESFQQERDETANCQIATVPNDVTENTGQINAIDNFSNFQRFLAPPTPSPNSPGGPASIGNGRQQFSKVGCALCHTPTLKTNPNSTVAALAGKSANLYSDLALHAMGPGLADNILQGAAQGDEFRTAPLWGLGQRLFFLHDGRTDDLVQAIQAHRSGGNSKFGPSEANEVIDRYNRLDRGDQQDLINFLRSL
jgi:mono/diheme cytochrome c family protein